MSLGSTIAIDAALRRLDTVAGLDEGQLNELAQLVEVQQAPHGTCLLSLGSKDTRVLFLLEGELKLEAADGAGHVVCHTDAAALGPVSRLRPSRYGVTALSDVRYLMIEQSLLDRFVEHVPVGGVLVEEALMVASEPNELIDDSATHPLMFDVFDDLNHGRVVVPSDPEIAIRVGRALHAQGSDPTGIANTLVVCPAIALKVVRAAMVSNPKRAKIRNIKEAVVRLGSERAIELAVQCVLRESLRTRSPVVRKRISAWWERTMRVAAMCKVLARTVNASTPSTLASSGCCTASQNRCCSVTPTATVT
ncbi:MAG: HDOD domain-containing protein [Chromatiaceae bacterium]|nr:HDOD domain-containing protein [Chromatiaceae bacterium]